MLFFENLKIKMKLLLFNYVYVGAKVCILYEINLLNHITKHNLFIYNYL